MPQNNRVSFRRSRHLSPRGSLAAAAATAAVMAMLLPGSGWSYKVSPMGTDVDQKVEAKSLPWFNQTVDKLGLAGLEIFSRLAVHEEITRRAFDCATAPGLCRTEGSSYAGPYTMAGVRWNDDPPFQMQKQEAAGTPCIAVVVDKQTGMERPMTIRFTTQPLCWDHLFREAQKSVAAGNAPDAAHHAVLMARSHYGDLQFLHAMASQDGEPAGETRDKILMWAEFTWKVYNRDFFLNTLLSSVNIAGFEKYFGVAGKDVQSLFALGSPNLRPFVDQVAFGSLLHMVEDSFAAGHTERLPEERTCAEAGGLGVPGRVQEYHSYAHQDPKKHGREDERNAYVGHAAPVDEVGQALLQYRLKYAKWEEVRPYLACVFQPVDPNTKATPGAEFRRF